MGNERSTLPWAKLLAPRLLAASGLLSAEGEMALVEGLATPLPWRILWTEEPGGL